MAYLVDYSRMTGMALGALLCLPACGYGAVADTAAKSGVASGKADYSEIYEKNVFDPNRQPWVDTSKPADPAVPALNPGDVEVYGVMSVGNYKKAIIKLGPSFKGAPPPGKGARPFVMVAVGQALGSYTLAEISEKNIVLEGGGARYPVAFTKKSDRPPPGPVAPVSQVPVVLPAPTPTMVPGIEPIAVAAISPAPPVPQPEVQAPAASAQQQQSPTPPSDSSQKATPEATNAPAPIQGRTLMEAIEMANRAAQSGNLPPPPPNPFVKR